MNPNTPQGPQPQQPSAPVMPPTNQPVNPSPSMPSPIPAMPKKSKTGLIIGLVVGLLFVGLIIVGLIYFLFLSDAAVSQRQSTAFMNSMASGNIDNALKFTDGSSETRSFLESMAPGVKADEVSLKDSGKKDNKRYFLYGLSGATNTAARTELSKEDGKWMIAGFTAGSDNLALMPGASAEIAEITEAPKANPSQCLVQADFDNWYKNGTGLGKTATEYGFKFHDPTYMMTTNVHFPADSLEYKNFDNTGAVENITKLAQDPSVVNKQWTIRLYGSVGTSQADKDFANQRAEKVKADFISAGVPANKVAIDPPQSATDYEDSPNETSKSMSRVVVIMFDPTCSETGNTPGTDR